LDAIAGGDLDLGEKEKVLTPVGLDAGLCR
jgi:hypothetical protein